MKYFNARTILYTKLEDTNASLREKYGFRKKSCDLLHEMIKG